MKKIFSKQDPSKLLHVVHTKAEVVKQEGHRNDLSPEEQFIQIASLKMKRGQTFKAHQHIWREGEERIIPQESWIIISGMVECFYYDLDGTLLETAILSGGDCSITFEGGHNYLIHADNTIVYEVKSARYYGQAKDKVFL